MTSLYTSEVRVERGVTVAWTLRGKRPKTRHVLVGTWADLRKSPSQSIKCSNRLDVCRLYPRPSFSGGAFSLASFFSLLGLSPVCQARALQISRPKSAAVPQIIGSRLPWAVNEMAERPEDLNLPNAVITRIIKEAVSAEKSFYNPSPGGIQTFGVMLQLLFTQQISVSVTARP